MSNRKSILEKYSFRHSKKNQVNLPNRLREISGLASTKDGRIFCHNDEDGIIFQINPNNGKIIKRFQLGKIGLSGDFEGIAIAGSRFFIIESNGNLYEFREGKNLEKVDVTLHNLGFKSKFEIEGLCWNENENSLLIACKNYPGKKFSGNRAIYSFSLKDDLLNKNPRFLLSLDEIKHKVKLKDFFPSGIEINSLTGSIFIISAKGQPAIAEISQAGKLLHARKLKRKFHKQPEGITFYNGDIMLISDEGGGGSATLTKYKIEPIESAE